MTSRHLTLGKNPPPLRRKNDFSIIHIPPVRVDTARTLNKSSHVLFSEYICNWWKISQVCVRVYACVFFHFPRLHSQLIHCTRCKYVWFFIVRYFVQAQRRTQNAPGKWGIYFIFVLPFTTTRVVFVPFVPPPPPFFLNNINVICTRNRIKKILIICINFFFQINTICCKYCCVVIKWWGWRL